MGTIRLKVQRFIKKASGYYWQPTLAIKALGFIPESLGTDLHKALARADELNKRVSAAKGEPVGTNQENVKALIARYVKTRRYEILKPASKKGLDGILRRIEERSGRTLVALITRRDMVKVKDALTEDLGWKRANKYMRVWKVLLGLAWDIGWRDDNPAISLSGPSSEDRDRVWTPGEVEQFCKAAPPSMVLAAQLALDIGQRPGDVHRLKWSDYDGAAFTLKQRKTGKRLRIPVAPYIRELLAKAPRSAVQIIVNEKTGRPYAEATFSHAFVRARRAAGLPEDLQFRDLRRTLASALGSAGATDDEIRAVTGHKSRKVVEVYVIPDDRMAAAGQAKKNAAATKVGK